MMKKLVLATLFFAVSSTVAMAADFNGKWTTEVPGRDGTPVTTTFTFTVSGAKLTGTMPGQMGEVNIADGKVDGDAIEF